MKQPRAQTGIALITILLVFAIATVIAAEIVTRGHRDLRRSENLFDAKQAYHFALSGEQYARQILYRDYTERRSSGEPLDTLEDTWAMNFPPFDIEDGDMDIKIQDIQARFNINNLVDDNGVRNIGAMNAFRKLQTQLMVTEDYSTLLVDWMDRDDTPQTGGAELESYRQGYLPANRSLTDRTELRLILGLTIEDYRKLEPLVVAIPKRIAGKTFELTKYNINTVDATLLEAISGLSSLEAKKIEDRQYQGGYDNLNDWLAREAAGLSAISNQLSVYTEFFEVVVTAKFRERVCTITTQFYRDPGSGQLTVIKRQIGAG